jgi:spore coat protein CotH
MKPFKHNCLVLMFIFFITIFSQAQDKDISWKLYDDSQVAVIQITMSASALSYMYNNPTSDSLHIASVHFSNALIDETIDSVGIRIRGNTSRYSQKKSFKLDFNQYKRGRRFFNLKALNLNGEHNDPSIIRSKLVWDLCKDIGMKGSRAAHSTVSINGIYYGLYISVENIDDDFLQKNYSDDSGNLWKCLYPADLVYKGTNPNLYKTAQDGRRTYELNTNQKKDDYSELARLISIINNTPDNLLEDSLEKILVVPEVIKYFAMNVMVGSWDDYWFLKNNYYLYHEPSKNIFHWLPYDYDNTFGIDWFNIDWSNTDPYIFGNIDGTPRPLVKKLMDNPEYRNLYTHFLEFYNKNVFNLSKWESRIDRLKDMILPFARTDGYRTRDYNFTFDDFINSYSATGYSNQHVKSGIKEFINNRSASLNYLLNWIDSKPVCYKLDWYPKNPNANDTIFVMASAFSNKGIKDIKILFSYEDEDSFHSYPMSFQPVLNTKKVEESDRYIGKIPPLRPNKPGDFSIQVSDNNDVIQNYPRNYSIKIKAQPLGIVINELLAKNNHIIIDQDGQYDDWLELYNAIDSSISLTGKYLTNSKTNFDKWKFKDNLILGPHNYLLIWCDNDTNQVGLHTNFKLSADGEFVALVDNDGLTILDSITIGKQSEDTSFGRYPDGSNYWQFLKPSPAYGNNPTIVESNNLIPQEFGISAFPNPFNPSIVIKYQLPVSGRVNLKIYNSIGQELETLVDQFQNAGFHSIIFTPKSSLSSGIYICSIKTGELNKTIKLMYLK